MNITSIDFLIRFSQPVQTDPLFATSFRGTLGHLLRRNFCQNKDQDCVSCSMNSYCVYCTFFSPVNTDEENSRFKNMLRPFVIQTDQLSPVDFIIRFNLFGDSDKHSGMLIMCMNQMQDSLVLNQGKPVSFEMNHRISKNRFDLDQPVIMPGVQRLFIETITPVKLTFQRRPLTSFSFEVFIRNLLLRARQIHEQYGNQTISDDIFQIFFSISSEVMVTVFEQYQEGKTRYTYSRCKTREHNHNLIGVSGVFGLEHKNLGMLFPLLDFGQYCNLGKDTSFGMGRYRVISEENALFQEAAWQN